MTAYNLMPRSSDAPWTCTHHGEVTGKVCRRCVAEHVFLAPALAEPDPVARYRYLTGALAECDSVVSKIADERAVCAYAMSAGRSLAEIAAELGCTRARAQQLVERGRAVRSAPR